MKRNFLKTERNISNKIVTIEKERIMYNDKKVAETMSKYFVTQKLWVSKHPENMTLLILTF